MLVPFRPAVFACPMRYTHTEKPKQVWPPPYPAWPEIADPSNLYTLPTLASHPAIQDCSWTPRWVLVGYGLGEHESQNLTDRELIYLMFPEDAEELLAKLPPTSEEQIYGAVMDLLDPPTQSVARVRLYRARGIADPEWGVFAREHEYGHYFSFRITRPTIREVNRIASGIFDLFKKLTLTACENFWNKFHVANDKLVSCLDKALVFEELRAHLYAFSELDPKIRARIEPDLRNVMAKEDTISCFGSQIPRSNVLDVLALVTDEDWELAICMTYLAEYVPADPLKRLYFMTTREMTDYTAMMLHQLSNRACKTGWSVNLWEPKHGIPDIDIIPPKEDADSAAHHLSLSDVRELVFMESLRQQCAQFFGVSLVCPYRQSGRTCCGFGHYMRAIWEHVPAEYRSAKAILLPDTGKEIVVRPPRNTCLHYGLG